jgi:hypothetical protein
MNEVSAAALVLLLSADVAGAGECARFEWGSVAAGDLSSTVRTASPVRQLEVPAFGRMLEVSERTPSGTVTVMGKPLRLDTVYGLDDADVEAMLKSAGLAGPLGMRPFVDGALAFDLPGRRIGFGRLKE